VLRTFRLTPLLLAATLTLCIPACGRAEERSVPSEVPAAADPTTGAAAGARVVMLGSGGPPPDPERSGPALAVLAGGRVYLVDFGPGVVRRAVSAQLQGLRALHPKNLTRAFVTHLHSDHTAGYSDLILTPPAVGRVEPLEVYGPPGIERMTQHLLLAYAEDLAQRGVGRSKNQRSGYRVEAHDVVPGPIYSDEVVRVSAFRVVHGRWKHAYGYRFDAGGRSIVVSGDTAPTEAVVTACDGCDVLVHEIYCHADLKRAPPAGRTYFRSHHTSTLELAELAKRAKPKLLVLHHLLLARCTGEDLVNEFRGAAYSGEVVVAQDLAVY
jgi:ribonuclease Z